MTEARFNIAALQTEGPSESRNDSDQFRLSSFFDMREVFQLVANGVVWLGSPGRIHSREIYVSREAADAAIPGFREKVVDSNINPLYYFNDDETLTIKSIPLLLIEE